MGRIKRLVNDKIKEGDLVKIVDGSSLTDMDGKKLFIVYSYEDLTGSTHIIEDMEFIVDEIGVEDIVCDDYLPLREGKLYWAQDIVLTNGICKLRTSSDFVSRLK